MAKSDWRRDAIYIGVSVALWIALALLLRAYPQFEPAEAIAAFIVLGVVFPALALVTTRGVAPLSNIVRRPRTETTFLLAYLAVIAAVLVWGFAYAARIAAEPLHSAVLLAIKLSMIVCVPAAVLRWLGAYSIRELFPFSLRWADLRPALWMSLAALAMQGFLGRGLATMREAQLPVWVIAVAAPFAFIWLIVDVGVVEEFFFRTLLQERLSTVLNSTWGGLLIAAILFGLVHAPGLYLRTAATQEPVGAHPALLFAMGYSILLPSLGGLFLGVLWMRTKNLAVVAIAHASGDLLPNLVVWAKAFFHNT
jgi:membrane protease YdiL (CAAX protease family)